LSYYNLWKEVGNIRKFNTLSVKEQSRILNLLSEEENLKSYYADLMISSLKGKVDDKTYFTIASKFLKCGEGSNMRSNHVYDIVEASFKIDPEKTTEILKNSKSNSLSKLILICDNYSVEDEVKGLRSLSTSKYMPDKIHAIKYSPRLEALKKLPPIMRLKTLEALTASNRLKYNIFEDINEEDFRSLLFTSSLKHTSRVETVCNKYDELKHMGVESSVKVRGTCDYCDDYEINITSKVMRTKTGMISTHLGNLLLRKYCPFCHYTLQQEPAFIEEK